MFIPFKLCVVLFHYYTACFYSTATCCSRSGLPLSSASITVNGLKVTVKYYSTGNKQGELNVPCTLGVWEARDEGYTVVVLCVCLLHRNLGFRGKSEGTNRTVTYLENRRVEFP